MFTLRPTYLEKALLSAAAVLLLLSTSGQCAVLMDNLQTTPGPDLTTSSSVTTQRNNSSMEEPLVLRSHRSECGDEHANFCANGGICMYPQDNAEPSCICTPSFSGPRCMIISDLSHAHAEIEELIGITVGVAMIILALVVTMYCCVQRRCVKSHPLIKSAPASSV